MCSGSSGTLAQADTGMGKVEGYCVHQAFCFQRASRVKAARHRAEDARIVLDACCRAWREIVLAYVTTRKTPQNLKPLTEELMANFPHILSLSPTASTPA